MHAGKIHKAFFSVSATTTFLYVYSIAVAAVEKGYAFFFFKQKTAYEIMPSLVGSEMCIRDRNNAVQRTET